MVTFVNQFTANVTQQYANCVLAAEQFIASHWTNPVTITLSFDAQALAPIAGALQASVTFYTNFSYAQLRSALAAQANNPDAQAAVASLPASDPTASYVGDHKWALPTAYARMLGLAGTSGFQDMNIVLNTNSPWRYGQDLVDALEGGISKTMGRATSLTLWTPMELFEYSSAHLRDFTFGGDGLTTYFSVDGNTLLLPFVIGDGSVDFDAIDVFGRVPPGITSILFSPTDYKVMNALGWTPTTTTITPGPLPVIASGDFDGNGVPDFIWRRSSDAHMGMWSFDGATQLASTTDLGTVDINWTVLATGFFTPGASNAQMLMDYVPSGTMTVWSVNGSGQLTGINLGSRWSNVGFIAAGSFSSNAGPGVSDFLVSNLTDHHLYDWWIDSHDTLQGIDLGPYWANVNLVTTFAGIGGESVLVSNTIDHHLYDWSISGNTLQGIDLGPVWSNVSAVATGAFTASGGENLLVSNNLDHHLYDWWISNNTLQGIDLGPVWSTVQLVAKDVFDNNSNFRSEILVQNTIDHHLYEWWINSQNQLTGIDLGPYWANVQLIGVGHYNNYSANSELLVRNVTDGHFYEWWIAFNQLQGLDLGPVGDAPAGVGTALSGSGAAALAIPVSVTGGSSAIVPAALASPGQPAVSAGSAAASAAIDASVPPASPPAVVSPDPTSLLVQAMASFGGASDPLAISTADMSVGTTQLSETVAVVDQRLVHS